MDSNVICNLPLLYMHEFACEPLAKVCRGKGVTHGGDGALSPDLQHQQTTT